MAASGGHGRRVLPRDREHVRAVSHAGFDDPASDPATAADHDQVLAC